MKIIYFESILKYFKPKRSKISYFYLALELKGSKAFLILDVKGPILLTITTTKKKFFSMKFKLDNYFIK